MRLFALITCLISPQLLAGEETLGRLFHTTEQRARLDLLRLQSPTVVTISSGIFTLNGEVRRSSGHNTHWINGQPKIGKAPPEASAHIGETIEEEANISLPTQPMHR